MGEDIRSSVGNLLKGIDRYNPNNLPMLERYIECQCKENTYDLEANLAVLKLYQFNPSQFQAGVARKIMLKALTNLPHTDIVLCKCLIAHENWDSDIMLILSMASQLELCEFERFWKSLDDHPPIAADVVGFEDSIRRFVCHVVNITYQQIRKSLLLAYLNVEESGLAEWADRYEWRLDGDMVFIRNQEQRVKTKNIREKIEFDSIAGIMALSR